MAYRDYKKYEKTVDRNISRLIKLMNESNVDQLDKIVQELSRVSGVLAAWDSLQDVEIQSLGEQAESLIESRA